MPALTHSFVRRLLVVGVAVFAVTFLAAARKSHVRRLTIDPSAPVVELFDGIERGVLHVRVVPKNEFESRILIKNKSKKPVTVKIPKAVAAVHVLKQLAPFGPLNPNGNGNGNNNGNGNGNGAGQQVGGQLQPNGNQGFPNGNGVGPNNFFSIPAERTVELRLKSVCLEHGKRPPRLKMTYHLRRLKAVVKDPVLRELLRSADFQKTGRKTLQAAVWHLSSRMSWQQLVSKRQRHIGRRAQRYFTKTQIVNAKKLVEISRKKTPRKAVRVAAQRR
ncbi:MAG: hypothetical protein IID45_14610 [Planctomycetes bacterium]|nr:hypothetical protein [Planctomycetota bacterium]